jgi:hypothetical protein
MDMQMVEELKENIIEKAKPKNFRQMIKEIH